MDVYGRVTDQIVAALETAQRWQQPWTTAFAPKGNGVLRRPMNGVSRTPYRGINVPIVWTAGYSSPYWATYRAWQSVGAQVRKGEKGTLVVFWKEVRRPSKLAGSSPACSSHGDGGVTCLSATPGSRRLISP